MEMNKPLEKPFMFPNIVPVAYGDLLGIKKSASFYEKEEHAAGAIETVNHCIANFIVPMSREHPKRLTHQSLTDGTYIFPKKTTESLVNAFKDLVELCNLVISEGLLCLIGETRCYHINPFLSRFGLSFGSLMYTVNDVTTENIRDTRKNYNGDSCDRASELEKNQNWIGGAISLRKEETEEYNKEIEELLEKKWLIEYPVPFKEGFETKDKIYALNWIPFFYPTKPVQKIEEVLPILVKKLVDLRDENTREDVKLKIENTLDFIKYSAKMNEIKYKPSEAQ